MKSKSCEESQEETISTFCDEETREIYLTGEIDLSVYQTVVAAIKHLDKTNGNINLIINTPGGEGASGMAIVDVIKMARNKVIGNCFGQCMSMGMSVLQACDTRLSSPNCRFMIHNAVWSPSEMSLRETRLGVKELETLNESVINSLLEKSGLTLAEVKNLCDAETFMSAETAMGYGFLDGIFETNTKIKKVTKKGKK
jgi:ATP-dependent Clp protease protease subunit